MSLAQPRPLAIKELPQPYVLCGLSVALFPKGVFDYVVVLFSQPRRKTDFGIMRLINTATIKLEEFADSSTPVYAILSHRRSEEGITFKDLNSSRDVCSKKGFAKLEGFCHVLRSEGHDYDWSDTCCANKQSLMELGIAINLIFRIRSHSSRVWH